MNRLGVLKKIRLSGYIFGRSKVWEIFFDIFEFSKSCSRFFRRELTPRVPKSQFWGVVLIILVIFVKKMKNRVFEAPGGREPPGSAQNN